MRHNAVVQHHVYAVCILNAQHCLLCRTDLSMLSLHALPFHSLIRMQHIAMYAGMYKIL